MTIEDKLAKVVATCLFRAFEVAVVRILNVAGVDDTVSMLRSSADALEANRVVLEAARGRKPAVQA